VVRLLVASDASWELGRFLLMMMPAAAGDEQHRHRYCLLTASGRKFVTLMQEVVDGVACPLQSLGLGMDGNAAQLVADLFREYVRSILDMRQLSVLVNCSTLVSLLPIMARTASA